MKKKATRKTEICKKQAQKTSKFQFKQAQKQATRKSSKKPQLHKKTSPNLRENRKVGNTVVDTMAGILTFDLATVRCVGEVSTNLAPAYPPSFVRLAEKNREPTHTSTNYCSLINH